MFNLSGPKSSKVILAAIAAAVALSAPSFAKDRDGKRGDRKAAMFERLDADKNGTLTIDEATSSALERFAKADANSDNEISLDEMVAQVERQRLERRAKRMLRRMDYNGDGKVTRDEVESRARKRFAMMDRNDDGVLEKDELKVRKMRGGKHKRGHSKGHRRGDK